MHNNTKPIQPFKFQIPEEAEGLKAFLSFQEALEAFGEGASLLVGRISAKQVWEILEQLIIIARFILQNPHWSESTSNPQIVSTGDVDELHNEKLIKRSTNHPIWVPHMSETEQRWLDSSLAIIHERISSGSLSWRFIEKPPIVDRKVRQADLFYLARKMSKQNSYKQGKGQSGKSRGKSSPKSHK